MFAYFFIHLLLHFCFINILDFIIFLNFSKIIFVLRFKKIFHIIFKNFLQQNFSYFLFKFRINSNYLIKFLILIIAKFLKAILYFAEKCDLNAIFNEKSKKISIIKIVCVCCLFNFLWLCGVYHSYQFDMQQRWNENHRTSENCLERNDTSVRRGWKTFQSIERKHESAITATKVSRCHIPSSLPGFSKDVGKIHKSLYPWLWFPGQNPYLLEGRKIPSSHWQRFKKA